MCVCVCLYSAYREMMYAAHIHHLNISCTHNAYIHSDTYVLYKCVRNICVNVLHACLHNVFSFSTVLPPKKKGRKHDVRTVVDGQHAVNEQRAV